MTAADASANVTDSQEPVREWEELGRGIFSRSQRRRAANGVIPYQVFLERAGERNISVDRLSTAPAGWPLQLPAKSQRNATRLAVFTGGQ